MANEQSLNSWTIALMEAEGVLFGLEVTAQSTPSMTCNLSAGMCFMEGVNSFIRYPFYLDSLNVLSFGSPPSSGQKRIDLVVAKVVINNSNETVASIEIVAGTPAITPVDPPLVETSSLFYLILARVTINGGQTTITTSQIVMSGTSSSGSHYNLQNTVPTQFPVHPKAVISDDRLGVGRFAQLVGDIFSGKISFTGTNHAGLKLQNLNTTQRDALIGESGDTIQNTDTGGIENFDGVAWNSVYDPLTDVTSLVTSSNIFS